MRHENLFFAGHKVGRGVLHQINLISRELLGSSPPGAPAVGHLSEYVTSRGLAGEIPAQLLFRYHEAVMCGRYNPGHGYDEDPISLAVSRELKKLTNSVEVVTTSSGTAANLCLIASFVDFNPKCHFVACTSEHTVNTEGEMLRRARIASDKMILIRSKNRDGFIDPDDLENAVKNLPPGFIFQLAIPSNEGVVPTKEQLARMVKIVKDGGGVFLVDGARLANALVYWNEGLDFLASLGIDGFTLGTSKKGGVAEVVCIPNKETAPHLKDVAKSFGQLSSKGGALAFVTGGMLTTDYWRVEAEAENAAAAMFAEGITRAGLNPHWPVCSNMVFLDLTLEQRSLLENDPMIGVTYGDYGESGTITRVVFAGFTPPDEITGAVKAIETVSRL